MRRHVCVQALVLLMSSAFAQQLTVPADTLAPLTPLKTVEGQYSDEARIAGLEGSVLVTGVMGQDGLRNLEVSRPLGLGLDERAMEAASQWRAAIAAQSISPVTVAVEFALPSKQSRWHLVSAEFAPPTGVSRPTFARADYPVGPGIGVAAYDEGRILGAIGRAAAVTMSFDIDESGYPGNFTVLNASAEVWGPQAAMLIRTWRFHPGTRGGVPVTVPCTVKLLWGPEDFSSRPIARQLDFLNWPPAPSQLESGTLAVPKPAPPGAAPKQ